MDYIVVIRHKGGNKRSLEATGRYAMVPPNLIIEWQRGTYTIVQGKLDTAKDQVQAALTRPMTLRELVRRTGLPRTTVQRAVAGLETTGSGTRLDPRRYVPGNSDPTGGPSAPEGAQARVSNDA